MIKIKTLKWSKPVRKVGNSYVVTIPAQYFKMDFLKEGETYHFEVTV